MGPIEHVRTSLRSKYTCMERGINGATQIGLEPIGKPSCFAYAVGIHKDLPNVVIKVVNADGLDGFLAYAEAIYNGELVGNMFPVIKSITYVDNYAVVVIERLKELFADAMTSEAETVGRSLRDSAPMCTQTEDFMEFFNNLNHLEKLYKLDVWPSNWMYRENGYSTELVLLDPLTTKKGLRELENSSKYYYSYREEYSPSKYIYKE